MNYYLDFVQGSQSFRMGFDCQQLADRAKGRAEACGAIQVHVTKGWTTLDRRAFDRGGIDRRGN